MLQIPFVVGTDLACRHRTVAAQGRRGGTGESVTQESVTIQLTAHEHEIGSLKHRMAHVESQVEAINKLTASVENLALSVQEMLRVQKEQAGRLLRLECRPEREAKSLRREIVKAVVSALVGAIITVAMTRL